ncbi:MAG: haloacid dehalogenase [Thermodesulfobacteriota bacterium]|nr:haloacid dehalogenase [Thermodesulfobacteriota bacterium]
MIRPGQIGFDIDGVFANTMGLFLEIARREYGINHIRYDDMTQYFLEDCLDLEPELIKEIINRILEGNFDTELKPIEGSVEVLSEMARQGPLLFVTARPTLSPIKAWVEETLPKSSFPIEVVATGTFEAKADALKARGVDFFVDDYLEICFMLEEQGLSPILFRQPWNRFSHPFREVTNWSEIRDLIDLSPS